MAFSKDDIRAILETLARDPEFRGELQRLLGIDGSLPARAGAPSPAAGDGTELAARVAALAEAQARTEQSLEQLTATVGTLAAAQARTEQRLEKLAERVEELGQAQVRTEKRMEELAAAQARTEQRLERLVERVEELGQAQVRTEKALLELTEAHTDTRRQLGGLTGTVGYALEDQAYKALPALLERDHGVRVQGRLRRDYVRGPGGQAYEVNILGEARRDGEFLAIVGEAKSQLSERDIASFLRRKLRPLAKILQANLFPVIVTYMVTGPDVADRAREKGVALYFSYDF